MLTSLQNPLVKELKRLHQAKFRHQDNAFLLEGTHLLEEALANGLPLQVVCVTEDWKSHNPVLWRHAQADSNRAEIVSPAVLQAVSTTVHPDGVVATLSRDRIFDRLASDDIAPPKQPQGRGEQRLRERPERSGEQRLRERPERSGEQRLRERPERSGEHTGRSGVAPLQIALETIQDPGNLGTIIRTAVAVGVDSLWLSRNCVDLDHPKVLRASAGYWFRMSARMPDDLPAALAATKQKRIRVVSTFPEAEQTYWDYDWTQPTLILLGNEGQGLSNGLSELADEAVRIPSQAEVESLNVAVACALLLYEASRQRRNNPP